MAEEEHWIQFKRIQMQRLISVVIHYGLRVPQEMILNELEGLIFSRCRTQSQYSVVIQDVIDRIKIAANKVDENEGTLNKANIEMMASNEQNVTAIGYGTFLQEVMNIKELEELGVDKNESTKFDLYVESLRAEIGVTNQSNKDTSAATKEDEMKLQKEYYDVILSNKHINQLSVKPKQYITVAIVPEDYPMERLDDTMFESICNVIWDILEKTKGDLPRFHIVNIIRGALVLCCEDVDAETLIWKVNGLLVRGISLKVIPESEIETLVKMIWTTKNVFCRDTARVLQMLQRFNPAINVRQWKVATLEAKDQYTLRAVIMDRASADYIKEAGYTLHLGVSTSTFKVIEELKESYTPYMIDQSLEDSIEVVTAANAITYTDERN